MRQTLQLPARRGERKAMWQFVRDKSWKIYCYWIINYDLAVTTSLIQQHYNYLKKVEERKTVLFFIFVFLLN